MHYSLAGVVQPEVLDARPGAVIAQRVDHGPFFRIVDVGQFAAACGHVMIGRREGALRGAYRQALLAQHFKGGRRAVLDQMAIHIQRSEEHTSELQALMRISYAVFCLKKQKHSFILEYWINTKHS